MILIRRLVWTGPGVASDCLPEAHPNGYIWQAARNQGSPNRRKTGEKIPALEVVFLWWNTSVSFPWSWGWSEELSGSAPSHGTGQLLSGQPLLFSCRSRSEVFGCSRALFPRVVHFRLLPLPSDHSLYKSLPNHYLKHWKHFEGY